ncbi:MAG: hypothetical protein LBB10_03765 [Bifidobacteriaceae bacterium]|jgi:hypothetical protein|nr:hypothetical protein [Bifidobacteriaceae bacterium]
MKNRMNKIQNALKQIKPQKIGAAITVMLFGLICAIGGYELRSSTDGASSPLPVSKGGTGANTPAGARDNLNAQEKLVSGTNIKTLDSISLLGDGNLAVKNSYVAQTDLNSNDIAVFTPAVRPYGAYLIQIFQAYGGSYSAGGFRTNTTGYQFAGVANLFSTANKYTVGVVASGKYQGCIAIKAIGTAHGSLMSITAAQYPPTTMEVITSGSADYSGINITALTRYYFNTSAM